MFISSNSSTLTHPARSDSGEGSGVTLIQPGDEGRYVTTAAFHGGMAASAAGLAHPAVFVDGLRRRAEAAGVSIHTGIRVTDIASSGVGPHTITVVSGSGTARGHRRIAAGDVVIATNG